jgi:Rrf2 family protein
LYALFLNMLSKKTKYAIKALVVLGKNADKPPMQISKIAEEEKIPKKFLEQILLDLRNAGFLYSKKGAGGGYSLNKDPKDIYLVQIMRITDGPIAMVPAPALTFTTNATSATRKPPAVYVMCLLK